MARAIELARKAGVEDRSGGCFGAVVVQNDKIVGEGFNQVYTTFDPTCHAEVSVIFGVAISIQFRMYGRFQRYVMLQRN